MTEHSAALVTIPAPLAATLSALRTAAERLADPGLPTAEQRRQIEQLVRDTRLLTGLVHDELASPS